MSALLPPLPRQAGAPPLALPRFRGLTDSMFSSSNTQLNVTNQIRRTANG